MQRDWAKRSRLLRRWWSTTYSILKTRFLRSITTCPDVRWATLRPNLAWHGLPMTSTRKFSRTTRIASRMAGRPRAHQLA
ncbi:putative dNA-binding protein [Burkholderia pseudomallei ABCPW 107]|nr:putative dNA-binding protein [Burkholderia pseudomallei ABCPW 107]